MRKTFPFSAAAVGLIIAAVYAQPARGQTIPFTFTGTSPVSFQMDQYGDLSSIGTFGTGTYPTTGPGTRMFWYPGKAAFRAGEIASLGGATNQWDNANIGNDSVAFGLTTTASGYCSAAFGYGNISAGTDTVTFGRYTWATGTYSAAFGHVTYAGGEDSFAAGYGTQATSFGSVAFGSMSYASGIYSSVFNVGNLASGSSATAFGSLNTASGYASAAFGGSTTASSFESFVIGQNNLGGGTSTSWVATDPLFEVGNGASSSAKSDAMVVYKSGVVAVHTELRCAAGGDLSMGSFTAGTAP